MAGPQGQQLDEQDEDEDAVAVLPTPELVSAATAAVTLLAEAVQEMESTELLTLKLAAASVLAALLAQDPDAQQQEQEQEQDMRLWSRGEAFWSIRGCTSWAVAWVWTAAASPTLDETAMARQMQAREMELPLLQEEGGPVDAAALSEEGRSSRPPNQTKKLRRGKPTTTINSSAPSDLRGADAAEAARREETLRGDIAVPEELEESGDGQAFKDQRYRERRSEN
ncbi:hypothetical protein PHYSODRAFT_332762 [Phytophthora sojae]|uniref:Uncharacterized protein n=1 Tax=Phytophthora sojae (strain P6497) TaxID=1094619 RepID=G4ZNG3_PHYSP|nr:hypothetical protein PHYSODRAFT_332762 [Phytophthora sojae]EGZ14371.1 hypothetical protein PHYSODRAFT_332762 [Phytophthora sojae]|eukprot:XP_009528120.1 hypothetical protein PHYSODRAFT_332762 [Phytophthora sojae]